MDNRLILRKQWNIDSADVEYALCKEYKADSPNEHSCYACYDSWKRHRMTCSNNKDWLKCVGSGDKKWAERTAKHFNLTIEGDEK